MVSDMKPMWIWRSRRICKNDFAYFRKEFVVKKEPVSAILRVSAHNTVQAYLNGERLGGWVSPAPTDPRARKYYTEYDITAFFRESGERHCLTADAHYLGGGGQNYADGLPGFWLELALVYKDGSHSVIASGKSWEVLIESPHAIGTPYQQNRSVSAIEDFDASKLETNWRLPGRHALRVSKAKIAHAESANWRLERQRIPEGEVECEILPEEIYRQHTDNGYVQVFDTGRIVSGWPKLKLKGYRGSTVRLRYAENLDEHGRVAHRVCNEDSAFYYDQYRMRGDEEEEWQPSFSYKAFRYVEVTGYPERIEPGTGLRVCHVHTALAQAGNFRCSDPFLNRMYDACIATQKNNVLGQVVDCPHREQAQYLADADLQAETLFYNFDGVQIIRKTLEDFEDAQLEDGTFPFVAPGNYRELFRIRIPEWDLHFATLLWKLYEATGDEEALSAHCGSLFRMLAGYMERLDEVTGLLPKGGGWNISDWPYPTVDDSGNYLTVQQLKLANALRIAAKVADLIGRKREKAIWTERAETLVKNIEQALFDPSRSAYRDSFGSLYAHQGVTAYALYANLIPEEHRSQALIYAASREWECKTVLSLPLLRAFFEQGEAARAYGILSSREYPGWGYMINQGASTMWEGWEDVESHSHAWNGYPARLLQEYIVGIRSTAPGFKSALIKPYLPPDLDFAEASVWTPYGKLSFGWRREVDGIRCHANVPKGIEVLLEMSDGGDSQLVIGPGEQEWSLNGAGL